MCDIDRRDFVKLGTAGAAGLGLAGALGPSPAASLNNERPVFFHGDGLNLSPKEYADVLAEITAKGEVEPDYYSTLENHSKITIRRIPEGSNVFVLEVRGTDPAKFRDRMMSSGVSLIIQVNETWAAVTAEELGRRMDMALTARL